MPATSSTCRAGPSPSRLDCVWLCKLNEWGMLRRSFVPPEPVRDLRALTRLRANLTHDRVRHQNRIEKILEDALLKVSSVISDLMGGSGRRFLQALADGERSPAALAALGDYRLHASKAELAEALTGRFRDIHGFEIGMLLELIDDLSAKITELDERIEAQLENVPGLGGVCTSCGQPGPDGPCTGCGEPVLGVIARLDEITGIGRGAAEVIVAELGTDMTQFPTPGHAASWAKLTPRAIQSGATRIRLVTGRCSVPQAARVYSLIRPLRIGFRRTCCMSMSVTAARIPSRSSSGTCCAMPW